MDRKKTPKLSEEIKKLKKERDDYKEKYLRALADYHNFEKRVKSEKEDIVKNATENFIIGLLSFLDNLDKAEEFVKNEGLKIIKDQFLKLLENKGLKEIEVIDLEFDPHNAEAVDVVRGEKDNVVVEVVRRGYEINGKVVRPAQVKVSKTY